MMTAFRKFLLALRATSLCRTSTTFSELDELLEPKVTTKTECEFERRMAERAKQYLGLYPARVGH